MQRVCLFSQSISDPGGIKTSLEAQTDLLDEMGIKWIINPELGQVGAEDFLWCHTLEDPNYLKSIVGLKKKHNIPLYYQIHDYRELYQSRGNSFKDQVKKLFQLGKKNKTLSLLKECDRVIVYSTCVAKAFSDSGIDPTKIVKAIPYHKKLILPESEKSLEKSPVLLWVGRMVQAKGPTEFVKALGELVARDVAFKAIMVGDGPEEEKVSELAMSLEVDDRLFLKGWVEQKELSNLYQRASAVCATGLWPEPFGLVGLEAMQFGVPVISYNNGGVVEWCKRGHGHVLLEENNPVAMAIECQKILFRSTREREEEREKLITAYKKNWDKKSQLDNLKMLLGQKN